MSQGERRLAAIMFTDIAGYTALTQEDESSTLQALEKHRSLIRPLFSSHGGREIKTIGDAFLVEFQSALDAVLCAVAVQQVMHDRKVARGDQVSLRIGIHVGDVVESENDILGDAVNIASRIEPLAEAGGVCISGEVYSQVRNKSDLAFVSLGEKFLKNVSTPVTAYRAVMPWEKETVEPTPQLDPKRVAVLPFVSMSPDPNDEYFADGLTEELIDRLCQVRELAVIARTSVMNYKHKEKNASQIGKELKVAALIEGSIRKAGDKIRVTAQLIDSSTEEHMWSSRYDRNLEDIFAVQTDIAENITGTLKIRLLQGESERISRVPTNDPEAHALYMKGRSHVKVTEEDLRTAQVCFEKAVEKDPSYADPYRGLAGIYYTFALHEIIPTKDAFPKVREYANKALKLDSSSVDSHLTKALLLKLDMDFRGERKEVQNALELNSNLAYAHWDLARSYLENREFDMARSEIQKSNELDPLSVDGIIANATLYLYARNPDKALELYQKALSIDPENPFVIGNVGLCYVSKAMYEQGVEGVKRAAEMGLRHPNAMADVPYALVKAGRLSEAREMVDEMAKYYEEHGTGTVSLAKGYAVIGEQDKALELLERAYAEHSPLLEWAAVDFNLEGMRSNPRFQAFLHKLGLGDNTTEE